jgi:DNA-binding NarL/FixJ family response regulator
VGEFGDAETALRQMVGLRPNIVLVDINLPGQSGIDCVRTLKPLLPAAQFVMVTIYEDAEHIFGALSAGAIGYLLKRTPRDELIAALREVQNGGSPMSSNIARKVVHSFRERRPGAATSDELSKRENEVLVLLAQGYLCKEIADQVGVSLSTVKTYIRRIYEKLHVHSRAQAVALYADVATRK